MSVTMPTDPEQLQPPWNRKSRPRREGGGCPPFALLIFLYKQARMPDQIHSSRVPSEQLRARASDPASSSSLRRPCYRCQRFVGRR